MVVKPVKKFKTPHYPDKYLALSNPDLLKNIPVRWKNNKYMAVFASLIISAAVSGCSGHNKVAPVFYHGSGLYFNPHKYGFLSGLDPVDYPYYPYPYTIRNGENMINQILEKEGILINTFDENSGVSMRGHEVILDGFDSEKRIGYEFISVGDYYMWYDLDFDVSIYTATAAPQLRNKIKKVNEDRYIGVFYDPVMLDEKDSIEALKKQVEAFIKWLKAQGAI